MHHELKVYLVTINPRMFEPSSYSSREIVVLALDKETAFESALKECQLPNDHQNKLRTDIEEIKGPFENGSILFS